MVYTKHQPDKRSESILRIVLLIDIPLWAALIKCKGTQQQHTQRDAIVETVAIGPIIKNWKAETVIATAREKHEGASIESFICLK